MLTSICAYLHNYFCEDTDKHFGRFTISGGTVAPLDFLQDGQYFRIVGSVFNDGVYQYPAYDLTDETFDGAIWAMKIPLEFLSLKDEIEKFNVDNPTSAYTSESFGGYSYTKATGANGSQLTWQNAFANKLNAWRKI